MNKIFDIRNIVYKYLEFPLLSSLNINPVKINITQLTPAKYLTEV